MTNKKLGQRENEGRKRRSGRRVASQMLAVLVRGAHGVAVRPPASTALRAVVFSGHGPGFVAYGDWAGLLPTSTHTEKSSHVSAK